MIATSSPSLLSRGHSAETHAEPVLATIQGFLQRWPTSRENLDRVTRSEDTRKSMPHQPGISGYLLTSSLAGETIIFLLTKAMSS